MNKDIINGVNVSECKLIISGGYSFPQCKYYFDSFAPACCQHEDCTYKQLQRAVNQYNQVVEQNKNLQTELNSYKRVLEEIENIIIQAKVTNNKKLRAILDTINSTKGDNNG